MLEQFLTLGIRGVGFDVNRIADDRWNTGGKGLDAHVPNIGGHVQSHAVRCDQFTGTIDGGARGHIFRVESP